MKVKQESKDRITVLDASLVLEMSVISVQGALKHKALPIGGAWKNSESECYTYHISAYLLGQYLGMTKEEVLEKINKIKNGGNKDEKINIRKRVG